MEEVADTVLAHAVSIHPGAQDLQLEEQAVAEEVRGQVGALLGADVEIGTVPSDFGRGWSLPVLIVYMTSGFLGGPVILKALCAWEEITRKVVGYFRALRARSRGAVVVSPEIAAALCLASVVDETQDEKSRVHTCVDLGDFHGEMTKPLRDQPLSRSPNSGRYVIVVEQPGAAHHFFVTDASGGVILHSVLPWPLWF